MSNEDFYRSPGWRKRMLRFKLQLIFSVILLTVCVAGLSVQFMTGPRPSVASSKEESVYDRVIKSSKIRCAYISGPPNIFKDPNTGKISGIFAELTEKAAALLQLQVEWTEEVSYSTMSEGLKNDRYDAVCSGIWQNSTRARAEDFSIPLYYSAVNAYVRPDEIRFANAEALNSPDVRISMIDGEMAETIAKSSFPEAARVALPQSSEVAQMLMNVTTGKADVAFVQASVADEFLKHNPGQLKNLTQGKPIRIFGNTIIFKQGQPEFKALLDTALGELINNGAVDETTHKYEGSRGVFYPIAYPYRDPEAN